MDDGAGRRAADSSCGSRRSGPGDRVEDLDRVVALAQFSGRASGSRCQAVRAGAGVDDDREGAARPSSAELPRPSRSPSRVPVAEPLRAPRHRAAVPGDVVGDPDRQPGPAGDLDQRLGQRRAALRSGVRPEDAVDAGGHVDGGGALALRSRAARRRRRRQRIAPPRHDVVADRLPGAAVIASSGRPRRPWRERPRPQPAPRRLLEPPQRFAARTARRSLRRRARAARSSFTSLPVSIPSGQASAQVPSAAQVSSPSYSYCSRSAASTGEPVRLALHLAAQDDPLPRRRRQVAARAGRLAEAALDAVGRDLLDRRRRLQGPQVDARVAAEDARPGASTPSGSASSFTRHISSVAFAPHSRST